jgi:RecB family exonuclease
VLTAHAAAGQEFDTVVVVGAVEGDFPSLARPEPMFDLGTLERRISRSERNRARLEDERRLFGMVLERARRRVVLTASDPHGEEAVESARSRFVDERHLAWTNAPAGPFDEPVSVAEAAAAWRRRLADPSAPPPERLASLDGLLALGIQPSRWWFQNDWTDTGAPLHETLRLSFSRLDRLENCELQFVLGEELGLGRRGGHQAGVGKIVHELIERCERGEIDRTLEALVAALNDRWDPKAFPSLAVSEAFRLLAIDKMLPNWVEHFGGSPAIASEVAFSFEFEGATIVGVIDRIGRLENGGTRITDFKTGKADRAPKAEESLQLGVYYLAVTQDEELAEFRPVRAVDLAYLRGHWRTGEIVDPSWPISPSGGEAYQQAVREHLVQLIEHIRRLEDTEVYRPDPYADCYFCDFKSLCPLYPEGQPLFPIAEVTV